MCGNAETVTKPCYMLGGKTVNIVSEIHTVNRCVLNQRGLGTCRKSARLNPTILQKSATGDTHHTDKKPPTNYFLAIQLA